MKRVALVVALLISFGVQAQESEGLYSHILNEWKSPEYKLQISSLTFEELALEIRGDQLAYAAMLVARANYDLQRYDQAMNMVDQIPNEINHPPLFFDVQLYRGQIYRANDLYLKADSVYAKWLEEIPKTQENYPVLATYYNNYASVKQYILNYSIQFALLDSAEKYIELSNDEFKLNKRNLHYKNRASFYLNVDDIKQARKYVGRIDTVNQDAETKIRFITISSQLLLREGNYEEALAGFILARDLATDNKLYTLRGEILHLGMQARYKLDRQAELWERWKSPTLWIKIFFGGGVLVWFGYSAYRFSKEGVNNDMADFISGDVP